MLGNISKCLVRQKKVFQPKITKPLADIKPKVQKNNNNKTNFINWFKLKKDNLSARIVTKFITNTYMNLLKSDFKTYVSKDFNKIKQQLIELPINGELFKNCNSAEDIFQIVKNFKIQKSSHLAVEKTKIIHNNSIGFSDKLKRMKSIDKEWGSQMFDLEKALSLKSTDPKVIEIEKILKEKYGMKFVSLKDDYEHGLDVLKACETMSKNGLKIPENYIVSHSMMGTGQALYTESATLHIPSKAPKVLYETSIDGGKLHSIIHEFGHNLQNPAIYLTELPKQFKDVPKMVSTYAAKGSKAELWAELFAKIQLTPQKVTKAEWDLFKYLENFMKQQKNIDYNF